ncbi:MAG: helix-turn-helix domain-containing protein [Sedimentisphaeraceae bacterium JB056]
MLKNNFDKLKIDVLNIEKYRVGSEWQHTKVNSPYSRLYYILEGRGYATHHNQRYVLQPGMLYLIPEFTTVDLYCPEYFVHYYIHFNAMFENGLGLFNFVRCQYKISASKFHVDPDVIFRRLLVLNPGLELLERDANKPIYRSIIDRCRNMNRSKSAADLIEINAMMRLLLAAFIESDQEPEVEDSANGISRLHCVIEYIHENINQPLKLEELAEIVDLNPVYFSALFTKLMGVTPIRYINNRKIEKAQIELLSSHKTLDQISAELGFSDVFYFSRLFKKIAGTAPGKYRKQFQTT